MNWFLQKRIDSRFFCKLDFWINSLIPDSWIVGTLSTTTKNRVRIRIISIHLSHIAQVLSKLRSAAPSCRPGSPTRTPFESGCPCPPGSRQSILDGSDQTWDEDYAPSQAKKRAKNLYYVPPPPKSPPVGAIALAIAAARDAALNAPVAGTSGAHSGRAGTSKGSGKAKGTQSFSSNLSFSVCWVDTPENDNNPSNNLTLLTVHEITCSKPVVIGEWLTGPSSYLALWLVDRNFTLWS